MKKPLFMLLLVVASVWATWGFFTAKHEERGIGRIETTQIDEISGGRFAPGFAVATSRLDNGKTIRYDIDDEEVVRHCANVGVNNVFLKGTPVTAYRTKTAYWVVIDGNTYQIANP